MRDKAIVFESGEGKVLSARGSTMFFKATHASTNGAFSLMERTLPPAAGSHRLISTQTVRRLLRSRRRD
jgi:hypothetical protein